MDSTDTTNTVARTTSPSSKPSREGDQYDAKNVEERVEECLTKLTTTLDDGMKEEVKDIFVRAMTEEPFSRITDKKNYLTFLISFYKNIGSEDVANVAMGLIDEVLQAEEKAADTEEKHDTVYSEKDIIAMYDEHMRDEHTFYQLQLLEMETLLKDVEYYLELYKRKKDIKRTIKFAQITGTIESAIKFVLQQHCSSY